MIRGIFCHDLPIYKDKNGIYCSTTLTDALFQRYFHVVDELVVAARVYSIDKSYEDAHQEKITLPNIKVLEFPNLNTIKNFLLLSHKAKKKLQKEMENIDLIFIRGGTIALMGIDIAKNLGKPYLIESAGCAWDGYWYHSLCGKIIAPYMELRFKNAVRKAAFVIYVTEKWLQSRYPTNGQATYASNVILTGINNVSLEKRLSKLESTDIKKGIVLGTAAGVNNKSKGQQFVIEAMDLLRKELNIRYELVGVGDTTYLEEEAKKHHVEDRVIFKGELSHDEVLEWLDSIDIYIQPSMQEGLPRSLIEAMSRACPAIGSTTAGIPELLEKEDIFKRGNVRDLVKTIQTFIRKDLSMVAKRNFEKSKEYEISKLNSRREKIYEQYRNFVTERNKDA